MILKPETYFIIVSKDDAFQADFRRTRVIANDKNTYYCTGEMTTKIEDAYKFEDKDDANEFLIKNIKSIENYEVRQLNVFYEVI